MGPVLINCSAEPFSFWLRLCHRQERKTVILWRTAGKPHPSSCNRIKPDMQGWFYEVAPQVSSNGGREK